jgi:AraC family transcriptional regulator, regulatory protein of adaptative response / methylated-DNA-[protein]-cysteine methyltransferase
MSNSFPASFSKLMDTAPTHLEISRPLLKASWFDTRLGPMIAVGDEEGLYLLEFCDRQRLARKIEKLKLKTKTSLMAGVTDLIHSIQTELDAYFEGSLTAFKTPLHLLGSSFQKQVWAALTRIPYGETRSYSTQATAIGKQSACRAVANANGANQLAIVIPCHRIIRLNGTLGGYGGGVSRKQWLLDHEKKYAK